MDSKKKRKQLEEEEQPPQGQHDETVIGCCDLLDKNDHEKNRHEKDDNAINKADDDSDEKNDINNPMTVSSNNNSNNSNNYQKNKKARKRKQDNEASLPTPNKNTSWKERNKEREQVHPGSYACAEMRSLWGISLPELDETNTQTSLSSSSSSCNTMNIDNSTTSTATTATNITDTTKTTIDTSTDNSNTTKPPKRKVALLLQFIGTNYSGMQINQGKRTIQAEVELALYKAGLLTRANFGYPKKYSWSNSARTDKGVHACAQVCSVKILLPTLDLDQVREMMNQQLPEDVSVGDVVQVPKSFCARTQRDKVGYQYMLPSFVLKNREEWRDVWEKIVVSGNDHGAEEEVDEEDHDHDNDERMNVSGRQVMTSAEMEALRETMRGYRVTQETLDRLKMALKTYEGTHKFHNYTRGKKWDDPSASRYILSFEVQDRLVDEHGIEWIPTLVVGQSFLLHQIRKMMCMAMDVARGAISSDVMKESFRDVSMNINTAPAQGLSLDMSYYEYFNKRNKTGEPLDWHSDKTSPRHLRWKKFKEEKVMKHIMEEEWTHGNFLSFMHLQETHIQRGNYERSL
jgi:tRNA pseudouridine(38-40) synthase